MKKYQQQLLKLASKFQTKYAQSQDLKEIIQNAASYGENSANGIMDFIKMIRRDKVQLSINVTNIDNKTFSVLVLVQPISFQPNYSKLGKQIQNYLEKHAGSFWKDASFPQIPQGITELKYSGTTPIA